MGNRDLVVIINGKYGYVITGDLFSSRDEGIIVALGKHQAFANDYLQGCAEAVIPNFEIETIVVAERQN